MERINNFRLQGSLHINKNMIEPTTEALLWEIAEMIADYNSRPDAKSKLGLSITESDL